MTEIEQIISYTAQKYKVLPENVMEKHPGVSIFRHRDSKKWFALLISLKSKSAFEDNIVLLNLKLPPGLVALLRDDKTYLPAYHMNKRHWISVVINKNVDISYVCDLIDESFALTKRESSDMLG